MLRELLSNRILWTAVAADVVAQVLKVLLAFVLERRWAPDRFLETGGMPSSHSAAVAALATGVGMVKGWGSVEFALAAVFSAITMYDAAGVRRAAGLHAQMLNELVQELEHLFQEGYEPEALKTLLGHTIPQVVVGAILGIAVALIALR